MQDILYSQRSRNVNEIRAAGLRIGEAAVQIHFQQNSTEFAVFTTCISRYLRRARCVTVW